MLVPLYIYTFKKSITKSIESITKSIEKYNKNQYFCFIF